MYRRPRPSQQLSVTVATAALFGVAVAALTPACAKQSFVAYGGTVTEAAPDDDGGYAFSFDPIADAVPIPGAAVSVCDEKPCQATTDDNGFWGPIWMSFPLFTKRHIVLTVTAEGYEPVTYEANYPSTEDPTNAEQFLNVRLKRNGSSGASDAGSAPDSTPGGDG